MAVPANGTPGDPQDPPNRRDIFKLQGRVDEPAA